MTVDHAFDPVGPLPSGRSVLEASAGTGKTWTIAALTCRYIAEKAVPIDQVLVVTFTRAATSELRERVRSRIGRTARFLRTSLPPSDTSDRIEAHLADADADERARRAERLERALAEFDGATITTLHGFASRLLTVLGLLSGTAAGRDLVADHGELVDEAINDLVTARFVTAGERPEMKDLLSIASAVLTNPDAAIIPRPEEVNGLASVRSRFASDLRSVLAERAERIGVLTYDELMMRAHHALTSPRSRDLARQLLASRFRLALIDEFQDTDRIQWSIVDALFPSDDRTLVIIGDPKQSIYAFRGADVDAYLDAVDDADIRHSLATNWRSDGDLLTGLGALLRGTTFGDERIRYREVTPAPGRDGSAIDGVEAPITIRAPARSVHIRKTRSGNFSVPAAREFIAVDVAAAATDLFRSATIREPEGARPVRPGDIAVLCRTGAEVELVRIALHELGVPGVVGRTGNVLTSDAAGHWLTLLAALEFPSSSSRVRTAALTPLIGWSPGRLLDADDDELLPLHEQVNRWSHVLESEGIPALWRELERSCGVSERVLGRESGERLATDLDHLTEILHASGRRGARGLTAWLADEIGRAEKEAEDALTRARRLETDADAVQVLTIHGSKGLEFPIVLCPFLWNRFSTKPDAPVFHPPDSTGRAVDVGGEGWDGFGESQRLAMEEDEGEEARLLYVAVTRARHHLGLWWAPCDGARRSLLSRLLFGRDLETDQIGEKITVASEDRLATRLQPTLDRSRGTIAFHWLSDWPDPLGWEPGATSLGSLDTAGFGRGIDHTWRRTSFSGITDSAHRVPADPETPSKDDEPDTDPVEEPSTAGGELPMAGFRGGARFGSLVHDILEHVDFTSSTLSHDLLATTSAAIQRFRFDIEPAELATALEAVIGTPLLSGNRPRLRDIGGVDRLSEMVFEMAVTTRESGVGIDDLAEVLRRRLPGDHPLAAYADRLRAMDTSRFHGFLTGAIDLTTRLGDPARYWIVDYKTNRLDPPGAEPSIRHYSPDRMAEAMVDGDYVLQALIYQVALHRYLRLRLPGYTVDRHLGGAMYLFVRGMIGPSTPTDGERRFGVFMWPADPDLILEADETLGGGR